MVKRACIPCLLLALLAIQPLTLIAQVPPQFRPNDPVIDETVAGQLSLFEVYAFEQSNQSIVAEVVDGVIDGPLDYTHPEFAGRLYPPVDLTNDSTYEAASPSDPDHGSLAASPALASTNNGKGVISVGGLSGRIKGEGFKVIDRNGNIPSTSFRNALKAVLQKRAEGINIRALHGGWAFNVRDDETESLLTQLGNQGVVLFWPTGTQVNPVNLDNDCHLYPVCYAQTHWNVVPVVGTKSDGITVCDTCNYGPNLVQFAAPSVIKVVSFLNKETGSTSVASPTSSAAVVAGAFLQVTLYREPNAQLALQLLKDGASTLSSLQGKVKGGRRVNPFRALMPIIVTDPDAAVLDTALAIESVTQRTGPFKVDGEFLFSKDKNDKVSRIILNVENVSLLPGEDSSAVTVKAVDSLGNHLFLPVEAVAPLAGVSQYTQVVIRLSANKPGEAVFPELAAGDVNLTLMYHQQVSNTATIQVVR